MIATYIFFGIYFTKENAQKYKGKLKILVILIFLKIWYSWACFFSSCLKSTNQDGSFDTHIAIRAFRFWVTFSNHSDWGPKFVLGVYWDDGYPFFLNSMRFWFPSKPIFIYNMKYLSGQREKSKWLYLAHISLKWKN